MAQYARVNSTSFPGRRAAAAAVAALTLATAFGVADSASAKALRKGDHGPRVVRLQKLLGITADGAFGDGTVRAVKAFQRRHHLTVDGLAGSSTVSLLRQIRKGRGGGSRSGRVKSMQRALGILPDGVFGPGTENAIKSFQLSHGLIADGVVGAATWRALGLGSFSGRPLKRGDKRGSRNGLASNGLPSKVNAMIAAANRIAHKPYIYGGGHGSFKAAGYDCSGSLSYVLHAAGLLRVSRDSSGFESYGRPGRGRWVTIYANGGHAFMTINGRRFDTSGMDDGTRWDRRARSASGYVVRHPAGL